MRREPACLRLIPPWEVDMTPRRPAGPNPAELKRDIDTGRTRDKVSFPDPAAAPLGTDDEAAGTPPSPAAVQEARAAEIKGRPRPSPEHHHQGALRRFWPWLAIAAALIVVALTLLRA
jgi:hypothetical protein